MANVFGFTRFLAALGVACSLLLAGVLFLASLLEAIGIAAELALAVLSHEVSVKDVAVHAIQVTDIILIAAALYIIAAGLYELFIGRTDLPAWLAIRSLDDLKDRLLAVSAAILVVSFVEMVAVSEPGRDLLRPGLAIAAVVVATGIFSFLYHRARDGDRAH